MALLTVAIHLILLATIGMVFFSDVSALSCYGGYGTNAGEMVCESDDIGCGTAYCKNKEAVRGCAKRPDYHNGWEPYNQTIFNISFGFECGISFCSGPDLCNGKGLRKTGLKCYRKGYYEDEIDVEECTTGHVGCIAEWDFKFGDTFSTLGCSYSYARDHCNSNDDVTVRGCHFCDIDLCNDASLIGKIGEKSTTSENEKSTPENEESTPENEKSTPKNEENLDPPNGASACIVQIVIVPIGMMALVIGAGLLTMMNI